MRILHAIFVAVLSVLLFSITYGADFATGKNAYDLGDFETALSEWQPLAEEGRADGQFGMGLLFANGYAVEASDEEAVKWYRLAANQGHALAQCNIAILHANGWGVEQSDSEAFKWFSLSADQGIVPAMVNLAKMYAGGFGAEQDNVRALKWFDLAAELGDNLPSGRRDDVFGMMSPEEHAQATQLATTWMESHQNLLAHQ